jgi:hypothetical protein
MGGRGEHRAELSVAHLAYAYSPSVNAMQKESRACRRFDGLATQPLSPVRPLPLPSLPVGCPPTTNKTGGLPHRRKRPDLRPGAANGRRGQPLCGANAKPFWVVFGPRFTASLFSSLGAGSLGRRPPTVPAHHTPHHKLSARGARSRRVAPAAPVSLNLPCHSCLHAIGTRGCNINDSRPVSSVRLRAACIDPQRVYAYCSHSHALAAPLLRVPSKGTSVLVAVDLRLTVPASTSRTVSVPHITPA